MDTIYIYIVSGHLKYFCNCVFGHNLPDIDMCCRNFLNEKGIYIIIFQDCKTGDLVVITKLVKLEKKEITHTVTERVFR